MLVCHVNKEDKKIFQKLYATTFVCLHWYLAWQSEGLWICLCRHACLQSLKNQQHVAGWL